MFEDHRILIALRNLRANQLVIMRMLNHVLNKEDTLMADAASVLAKITANTTLLQSIATAATALENGGHSRVLVYFPYTNAGRRLSSPQHTNTHW